MTIDAPPLKSCGVKTDGTEKKYYINKKNKYKL